MQATKTSPEAKPRGPVMLELPLDRITPSPTNPRKAFNEDRLKELSISIAEKGLISPILVRPNGKAGHYELVAGERRYRASRLAKLPTIPVIVRQLDDQAALELQVIENLQRADLSPMEEARGYDLLMKRYKYSADQLAEKLSRSKGYVYSTIKLLKLRPEAMKAVELGTLSRKSAELLARVPEEAGLEKLTREALTPNWVGSLLTFEDLKARIQEQHMRQLKGAPFPLELADLKDKAGTLPACTTCPLRAGNNPDVTDVRPDMCMLPSCHQRKLDAWQRRQFDQIPADKAVLPKEVFDGYGQMSSKWVSLADQPWEDKSRRSWKQLLKGSDVAIHQTIHKDGTIISIAPRPEAEKHAAKIHKIKFNHQSPAPYKPPVDKKQPQREAAAAAVLKKLDANYRDTPILGKPWLMLALGLLEDTGGGSEMLLPTPKPKNPDKWIEDQIIQSDVHGQIAWAVKLLISGPLRSYVKGWGNHRDVHKLLALADIDLAAEEKNAVIAGGKKS